MVAPDKNCNSVNTLNTEHPVGCDAGLTLSLISRMFAVPAPVEDDSSLLNAISRQSEEVGEEARMEGRESMSYSPSPLSLYRSNMEAKARKASRMTSLSHELCCEGGGRGRAASRSLA